MQGTLLVIVLSTGALFLAELTSVYVAELSTG